MSTAEKKTVLLEIKSNLQKYIDELKQAKKGLADAKVAVEELAKGQFKSADAIEKTNARHRQAKTDVSNATKMVDLATKANKAQDGSYEQLLRRHQMLQTALKLEGGLMIQNADGTYKMTKKYLDMSRQVDSAKKALDGFGKGIHDNRLNVGNYSQALDGALTKLSGFPGIVGVAASTIEQFTSKLGKFGFLGGVIGGSLAAITAPLVAYFKYSNEGVKELKRLTAGFKAGLEVLKGDLVKFGGEIREKLGKAGDDAGAELGARLGEKAKHIFTIITGGLFKNIGLLTGATAYFQDLTKRMNEAGAAGYDLELQTQKLHKAERAMLVPRAQATLQIKEARLIYADTNKTFQERYDAIDKAITLEEDTAQKEVKNAEVSRDIIIEKTNMLRKAGTIRGEDLTKEQEAIARVYEVETESAGRLVRVSKARATAKKELLAEAQKQLEAEEQIREVAITQEIDGYKARKSALKFIYDDMTAQVGISYEEREEIRKNYEKAQVDLDNQVLLNQKKLLEEQLALQLTSIDAILQPDILSNAQKEVVKAKYYAAIEKLDEEANLSQAQRDDAERVRKKSVSDADIKAGFDFWKLKNENETQNRNEYLDELNTIVDQEYFTMVASVEYEKMTTNQKLLIDEQYTAAKKQLSRERINFSIAEMEALGSAFGQLESVFAKHTAAAKIFGVAQATIAVYTAAAQVMADWKSMTVLQKIAAVSIILAQGVALINKIKEVSTTGGTAAPKAITSSPATQRVLAQPVGTTVLNQTQITQNQASTLASASMLSAADIANALMKMPPPIVTVEAIDAVAANKAKVEVRATI